MKRMLWTAVAAAAVGMGWAGEPGVSPAQAQGYTRPTTNPFNRPVYSPYLNLLRRGNSFTQNYYGLVRPQLEFQQDINRLNQQLTTVERQVATQEEAPSELPVTGHPTVFLNYAQYFLSGGGRSAGSREPTAPALPTRPPRPRR
jgi:hypothetical protein